MKDQRNEMKIWRFLFVLLLLSPGAYAQDNHNYATPKGTQVYFKEVQSADRMMLKMNELSALPENTDGLCVSITLRTNLSSVITPLKLFSFTSTTETASFMDVFYSEGTLTFRRKIDSGSDFYYDYHLYDPLFVVESGTISWEVNLFFTAYFFWIETRNLRLTLNNKYHSPIFFGINLPNHNFMTDYLGRSENARLVFGDPNPPAPFTMPEEVVVYAFNYASLKDELQKNFCDNN